MYIPIGNFDESLLELIEIGSNNRVFDVIFAYIILAIPGVCLKPTFLKLREYSYEYSLISRFHLQCAQYSPRRVRN